MNYLTSSRANRAQLELNKKAVNFKENIVDPALAGLGSLLSYHRMSAVSEIPEAVEVNCDVNLMRIVFNNLINNAAKHGTPGTEIWCGFLEGDTYCWFNVSNEGIGIPGDKLNDVFEEYTRFQTCNISGTGLRPYVARKIIDLHGGRIWAESEYAIAGDKVTYDAFDRGRERCPLEGKELEKLPKLANLIFELPKVG